MFIKPPPGQPREPVAAPCRIAGRPATFDEAIEGDMARSWNDHSTLEFANFPVGDEYLPG